VVIDNGFHRSFWSYADYLAQAIMFIPAAVAGLSKSDTSQSMLALLVICSVLV
jgi:hypothetical protein